MVFSCITFSCIIQMVYMCYWPHTLKPRKDQYVLSRSVDLLNVSTAVVDLDDWTVHVTYIDITVDFAFLRTACNFRGFIVTNSDTKSPRPNCILRVRTSSPRPYPVSPRSIMWPKRLIFFLRYTSSRTTGVDNVYLWCVLHAQRDAEYVRINNYFRLS